MATRQVYTQRIGQVYRVCKLAPSPFFLRIGTIGTCITKSFPTLEDVRPFQKAGPRKRSNRGWKKGDDESYLRQASLSQVSSPQSGRTSDLRAESAGQSIHERFQWNPAFERDDPRPEANITTRHRSPFQF
ncbi:hypothetical protein AVEN_205071-1 [Araneus ventricosus]|uniref:Uncharacterized protein n=1 Tax=Araneus ventricosus TaxID=182803 RepID=A0A4Y2V2G4_ARAVE|nr:hypothetical protein AVEN_205071-1 [Araneus ventricosus]